MATSRRSSALGGASRAAVIVPDGTRAQFLILQDCAYSSEAKVFRAHAPQGVCQNLVRALKLLANLQAGGDNLVGTIFELLQITCVLRKFIEVDNQEAVKIGDLERHKEVLKVVRPKCNLMMFREAYIREEVDELTLRAGDAGMVCAFIDTTNVGDTRCSPPLVDEDWHAVCHAICKSFGRSE